MLTAREADSHGLIQTVGQKSTTMAAGVNRSSGSRVARSQRSIALAPSKLAKLDHLQAGANSLGAIRGCFEQRGYPYHRHTLMIIVNGVIDRLGGLPGTALPKPTQ